MEDDIPEDVPEDIPEDEPTDMEDDIPEDVPEDIPEDEPTDMEDDIPEDVSEDIPEDESSDVDDVDTEEQPVDDTQDDVIDEVPADESEEGTTDVDSADTDEQPVDEGQEDVTDETSTNEGDETATDVDGADTEEQPVDDTQETKADETAETEDVPEEQKDISDIKNKFASFFNKGDMTNIANDTKEVNDDVASAQKMIDNYCTNDLQDVLSNDKKAVRLGDTVEFQNDEEFAKGLGGKDRAAGVNGYNNGKKSYVKDSGPHPKKTAIHEHNHQLSCNDVKDNLGYVTEYRRGVSINGNDVQVNEALTELFTKKMMGSEKMESGFGTDILKEAYYQNKPDLLKDKYESVMGENTWKQFSKAFDDSLSKYPDTEIYAKREHYKKYGTNLQTATDVKRQNAITYANKCATLFALKSKGVV